MVPKVVGALAGASLAACGGPQTDAAAPQRSPSEMAVVAEGPCARLSVQAVGGRRFVVFGDTGYDLALWVPGERLAAAQSIVELSSEGAFVPSDLLEGLPRDERGYVPAHVELGGDFGTRAWARLVTTRYAPHGTGKLFARSAQRYLYTRSRWEPSGSDDEATIPALDEDSPPLPIDTACDEEGLVWLPLAWDRTARGDVFVGGRCQDEGRVPYGETILVVARRRAGERTWDITRTPRSAELEGHVNVDLYARSANEAYLTAYEPFSPVEGRRSYLVRFDGAGWSHVELGVDEGLMSVAGTPDGTLWLAAGRGLYKKPASGRTVRVTLPALRFTTAAPALHVHTVRAFPEGDVWIEASYRVKLPVEGRAEREEAWASVLFGPGSDKRYFCDAREVAARAFAELR
jgi:hypothetical protein